MCDIRQIFYDEKQNFFVDDCGYIFQNIYTTIEPNLIYLFKMKKQDMFLYSMHGEFLELIYEPDMSLKHAEYEYIYGDSYQKIDRIERSFYNG